MSKLLQNLSEKLNGNYWEKGNIKRVYLYRGYNTKKMKTKTYIYQNDEGELKVSCYIDCPSQPFEYIKTQQEKIKNEVLYEIEEHTSKYVYLMTSSTGEFIDVNGDKTDLSNAEIFFTEDRAKKELSEFRHFKAYKVMLRSEYESKTINVSK